MNLRTVRGSQQRRIEVCVQVMFRVILAIGRSLMETHSVREGGGKQLVVPHGQLLQDICQT